MKHKRRWLWFFFPLLLSLMSITAVAVAFAAPTNINMITGTVTSPDGYPLPDGTLVKLYDADIETVHGIAQPDPSTGSFSIGPVSNGLYVLKAVPPESSGLTQSLPRVVSIVNHSVDIGSIALSYPQVEGNVFAPDGYTPTPAKVNVFLGDGQLFQRVDATNGEFAIGGLPAGGYWLVAEPTANNPYWNSLPTNLFISNPLLSTTLDLTLQEAQVWGVVEDTLGNPVPRAKIVVGNDAGSYHEDTSHSDGYWAIGGLAPGEYHLTAIPPWDDAGWLPPDPITITIPSTNNPFTITFQAPSKAVAGWVKTNTDESVSNAKVIARRVNQSGEKETFTDNSGAYQLDLAPGLWALHVETISTTNPSDWVYTQPAQLVYFHYDNSAETREQNFIVTLSDASVSGAISLPDGGTPPFTVIVGFYNNEGIGGRTEVLPNQGTFQLDLPNGGYEVIIHPQDDAYMGPVVNPIILSPNQNLDMGEITLLAKDAMITGTVSAEASSALLRQSADGVAGIPIIAWRDGMPGNLRTTTTLDGEYALPVVSGTWHIKPAPTAEQPYIYSDASLEVTVASGQTVNNINFNLTNADASIQGILLDENGTPAYNVDGWASATSQTQPEIKNGAPIINGMFHIHVPAGTYQVVAFLPAGSPYMSASQQDVVVRAGDNVTITLTLKTKSAHIAGALWDPRNNDVVEGLPGSVGVWSENNWAVTQIETGNGSYRLDVAPGLWHLNYRINPTMGYAKVNDGKNIPVEKNKTAFVPLPVIPKDGTIAGSVQQPDGTPLAGATIIAKGLSGLVKDLWLYTLSDTDGNFSLSAPYGKYHLVATYATEDWLNPAELTIHLPQNGTSDGHVLQFREANATISGAITVTQTQKGGYAHVWAWSDDGSFTHTWIPLTPQPGNYAIGNYTLSVITGTTWHMGAAFETSSQYWQGRNEITLYSPNATLDISLKGPYPKPAPVAVVFDAATPQHISLADGTQIYIPAGAMPVNGLVTLRIVPIATLPHQKHAEILRYGYAFLATDESGQPIEAQFNQDVVISFAYEEEWLDDLRIHENWLKPMYYSTTTNRWTFPESFVVDADANRVVMQIDHFTDFALSAEFEYTLYMPTIIGGR